MDKSKTYYSKTIIFLTTVFGLFFFSLFFLLSISVTSNITYTTDLAVYSYLDFPIMHFLVIGSLIYFIGKLNWKVKNNDRILKILMILFSVLTLFFFGGLSCDPDSCFKTAYAFLEKNPEDYKYLQLYKNQSGFILYLTLFVKFFGSMGPIFYKISSMILLGFILFMTRTLIQEALGEDYNGLADLCYILFLPIWAVNEFAYNEVHGLFYFLLGIYLAEKHKNNKYIVIPEILLIAFGCVLRSNYMILLIAYSAIKLFEEKPYKTVLRFIFVVITYIILMHFSLEIFLNVWPIAAEKHERDTSIYRWILIGLNDTTTGAGWWDPPTGFSEIPAKPQVAETIRYWLTHPGDFLLFEIRKMANGFTVPDFEAFDAYAHKGTFLRNYAWYKTNFYYHQGIYSVIYVVLNLFQSLIYFGNLNYLAINKNKTLRSLFGIIFFIGVSLFHIVWEIKSRYIIVAFLLIIPTGIIGIKLLSSKISNISKRDIFKIIFAGVIILMITIQLQHIILYEPGNLERFNNFNNAVEMMWNKKL